MDKLEFHRMIKDAEQKLRDVGIDAAATEVEIILEYLLEVERIAIYLHGWKLIDTAALKKFHKIIEKRATRYPLQYILGEAYFYGRRFLVNPDVMIPTPETETLCELAINYINNEKIEAPQILDLCTGSGVIAVTIASELPDTWVTASDISQAALAMARKNAAMNGVESIIRFIKSDMFDSIRSDERFDLILSNPPYIRDDEYDTLQPEVLVDPKIALVAGVEGLDLIKKLLDTAPAYLNPNGRIMFEMSYDQTDKIIRLTENDKRYRSFTIIKDLNDIDRVVILSV
ncbi:MAG: peptide chain release factor N(5)-glutamine methyltransferase [candidate division Zixibacteria bacterium HGW-Zixibacteria-1]|nr:MAG: peptide chain release factor N(5)-glutamine methyltransferase [candidate division Zixibacteria bacterium HGW-Zixibacteria-1]